MGQALAKQMYYDRDEYLQLEEQAPYKSEYYAGEILAMAGGSYNHSVICFNLIWGIREAIAGKGCVGFDSNMKLHIPKAGLFVYPDLMVVCGKVEFFEKRTDIIKNPILVIEVLSPATESFDRGKKFAYYRSLPSLREYVLVSQEEPVVEAFFEQDEKTWLFSFARGLDSSVTFQTLQCELALRELYQKIEWEPTRAETTAEESVTQNL